MKKLLQILFFSSTLALLGGSDPAKFNNYPKDQNAQKVLERAESNRKKALEIRRKKREAAEEERIVREYEAEKAAEEQAAAEERSREAGEEELNKEAAQWKAIYEIEAQAAAEKRSKDAAEKEKNVREAVEEERIRESVERDASYAFELETQDAIIKRSREAAEERFRNRKRVSPDTDKESLKRHSQVLQEQLIASEGQRPTWSQALFTKQSTNPIQDQLIELIGKESKSIKGAIYIFNNQEIAKAIADQIDSNGIKVSILINHDYKKQKGSECLRLLKEKGADMRISVPDKKTMHHKFLLFEDNEGESLLWNGSYNLSYGANTNNDNVIITNDKGLIKSFSDEFNRLTKQNKATAETQISS